MKEFKYNSKLKKLSRDLRKDQTEAERLLWSKLRSRQLGGFKFRRQYPYEGYILDFVCLQKKIVIELDGHQHGYGENKGKDKERDQGLKEQGYQVLRYSNNLIFENLEDVLRDILKNLHGPHPSPPIEGEGKDGPRPHPKAGRQPYLPVIAGPHPNLLLQGEGARYKQTKTVLDKICEQKLIEIEELKKKSLKISKEREVSEKATFLDALKNDQISIIAEVKKASPSAGVLRNDFDPAEIARIYEQNGASAISVITDEKFFQGSLENLRKVHKAAGLPILRKEFILDEVQIIESYNVGADAVLLIASILSKIQLKDLYQASTNLGMDVLVEVHNLEELEKIMEAINPEILGINSRNLHDFSVDLKRFADIARYVPNDLVLVAESGIETKEDVDYVYKQGASAILVGTSLVKSDNISKKLKEFIS